jgi:hypothetical protein
LPPINTTENLHDNAIIQQLSMVNKYPGHRISFSFFMLLISSLILFACTPANTESTATQAAPTSPEASALPSATPLEPTQEATPIFVQSKVVFVAAPSADPVLSEQISRTLSELAASEDLDFEQRTTFTPGDPTAEIKLLAAIPPDPGLAAIAGAAPATQFLGIAIPGLEPAANLTVIDAQGISPDKAGFLAGYLAAVATPEWRVGIISSSDSSAGIAQRGGFLNGAVFFCGLCRQTYPPFNIYPMFAEAPGNSSPSEWLALANTLIDSAVQTVYIPPGVGDDSLVEYLAEAGINIIATRSPLPGLKERWIAIITADFPLVIRSVWPDLIAGQGGSVLSAPLTFSDPNYNLFSPGRQHLVEKMLAELSTGFIDTGVESTDESP